MRLQCSGCKSCHVTKAYLTVITRLLMTKMLKPKALHQFLGNSKRHRLILVAAYTRYGAKSKLFAGFVEYYVHH